MTTFDIKSLYTQVPVKEVINDILFTVYERKNKSIFQNSNITKTVLKNMLNLCSNAIFLFNNKVLQQTDGVAMGSPLAPLLANWFVCRQEEKILTNKNIKPKFYIRYVDDIFTIFESEMKCDNFFIKLNKIHPNLNYTIEKPKIGCLPFLDVSVQKIRTKLLTSVYRKTTNTNILINWKAKSPKNWKVGLIKCLLNRALSICNNYDYYEKEIKKLKEIFQLNGYPKYLVNKIIKEFEEQEEITSKNFKRKTIINKKQNDLEISYFKIPYFGKSSYKFKSIIKKEFENYDVIVKPVFTSTKLIKYFSLKERCSKLFSCNIVYKFTCPENKDITYIGESKRQFFKRIEEHKFTDKNSIVHNHIQNCYGCKNYPNLNNQFKIIKICQQEEILSLEAMLIHKELPQLNIQTEFLGKGAQLTIY